MRLKAAIGTSSEANIHLQLGGPIALASPYATRTEIVAPHEHRHLIHQPDLPAYSEPERCQRYTSEKQRRHPTPTPPTMRKTLNVMISRGNAVPTDPPLAARRKNQSHFATPTVAHPHPDAWTDHAADRAGSRKSQARFVELEIVFEVKEGSRDTTRS